MNDFLPAPRPETAPTARPCNRTLSALALQRDPAAIDAYVACVKRRMGIE